MNRFGRALPRGGPQGEFERAERGPERRGQHGSGKPPWGHHVRGRRPATRQPGEAASQTDSTIERYASLTVPITRYRRTLEV